MAHSYLEFSRSHWTGDVRGAVVLVLMCVAFYLAGLFTLPPIDRDESRFAEASRDMLHAEGWTEYMVPMIRDVPRLSEPPLVYWLQVLTHRIVGSSADQRFDGLCIGGITTYRVPSVISAILLTLMTWKMGNRMFARPAGFFAGMFVGLSVMVSFDVRQARADMLMVCLTSIAQWALFECWSRAARGRGVPARYLLVLWSAVALGTLAKGPITPVVVACTVFGLGVFSKSWSWTRQLRWPAGVLATGLIVAAWLALAARQVGFEFARTLLFEEILQGSIVAFEGHNRLPGYHLLLLPILFWPGSLVLIPAALLVRWRGLRFPVTTTTHRGWRTVWQRWQQRIPGRRAELFCIAWLMPAWLLFELVAAKLPHYTMPLYPALALLAARALFLIERGWFPVITTRLGSVAMWMWVAMTELILIAVPVTIALVSQLNPSHWGWMLASVIVGQLLILIMIWQLWQGHFIRVQRTIIATALVTNFNIFEVVLPNLNDIWVSSRIALQINRLQHDSNAPLAEGGYSEDSLIFLTDGRIKSVRADAYQQWLTANPTGLLIMDGVQEEQLQSSEVVGRVAGFNYFTGRWVNLVVVQSRSDQLGMRLNP